MGWRVGDLPSPSLGSALGLLPCPNCNQLEIFFKSHPIEPFEIKICLLMGNLHFIVKRELSSFLALAANPGRVLVGGGTEQGLAKGDGMPSLHAPHPLRGKLRREKRHGPEDLGFLLPPHSMQVEGVQQGAPPRPPGWQVGMRKEGR